MVLERETRYQPDSCHKWGQLDGTYSSTYKLICSLEAQTSIRRMKEVKLESSYTEEHQLSTITNLTKH